MELGDTDNGVAWAIHEFTITCWNPGMRKYHSEPKPDLDHNHRYLVATTAATIEWDSRFLVLGATLVSWLMPLTHPHQILSTV